MSSSLSRAANTAVCLSSGPSLSPAPNQHQHSRSVLSGGSARWLETLFIPANLQGSGSAGREGIFSLGMAAQSALSDMG